MPVPVSPNAALQRGLRIVERVSTAGGQPVRFSELRTALPGVGDSTLTRLLRSLEELGYLEKQPGAGYLTGPAWESWLQRLSREAGNSRQSLEDLVTDLVRRSNESAAAAVLEGNRLGIIASRTAEGGVSIIQPGDTLYWEGDHAGSMVVLEQLSRTKRKQLLSGPFSRIANEDAFQASLRELQGSDTVRLDQSLARPGICRLAVYREFNGLPGSLFLCLTRTQATRAFTQLAGLLEVAAAGSLP